MLSLMHMSSAEARTLQNRMVHGSDARPPSHVYGVWGNNKFPNEAMCTYTRPHASQPCAVALCLQATREERAEDGALQFL